MAGMTKHKQLKTDFRSAYKLILHPQINPHVSVKIQNYLDVQLWKELGIILFPQFQRAVREELNKGYL